MCPTDTTDTTDATDATDARPALERPQADSAVHAGGDHAAESRFSRCSRLPVHCPQYRLCTMHFAQSTGRAQSYREAWENWEA